MESFWSQAIEEVIKNAGGTASGLTKEEAAQRLLKQQTGIKKKSRFVKDVLLFASQFKSPLVLLLVAAVILSAFLGETSDVFIILFILLFTGLLSFWQEHNAGKAVEALRALIRTRCHVVRSGSVVEIDSQEVVAGDIVQFSAGDIVPADCRIMEENDLHVNEAALTGESFPVEKSVDVVPADSALSKRANCLWQGTSVISGTAKAIVVSAGKNTVFGQLASSAGDVSPETSFEKGIRRFGFFLMQITIVLSVIILGVNLYLGRPVIESVLFALALTVGMAPELLPAIMTIAMSAGAKKLSAKKVIVKKLSSIQNLGEINLFCTDKTGTITEGVIEVSGAIDCSGNDSAFVKQLAFWNASFESGFANPIDDALRKMPGLTDEGAQKLDEVPYDFLRKKLSILVQHQGKNILVSKGAVTNMISACSKMRVKENEEQPLQPALPSIMSLYEERSSHGFRMIAVAYKYFADDKKKITKEDETDLTLAGFILLYDPPKAGIADVIAAMNKLGVSLRIITGDNKPVATYIGEQMGLKNLRILTGSEIDKMLPEALVNRINTTDVFAEIEPRQKEHIVLALKKAGNTVAYMGDGINDVAALKAADAGISVMNAVDVAKETADIVLLEKNLQVLVDGIVEGRKTFTNTLKYIYINTSATFGNMFSVAGASLVLPFLPMLPKQILATNFLTDFPYMAVASDEVDEEQTLQPQRWNLKMLRNFMIVFGIHSSVFDFITFFTLYKIQQGNEVLFRTGWFVESVCTELFILFIIRTRKAFWKSRPGKWLLLLSALALVITVALTYSPLSVELGLDAIPAKVALAITAILSAYIITADVLKVFFFRTRVKK